MKSIFKRREKPAAPELPAVEEKPQDPTTGVSVTNNLGIEELWDYRLKKLQDEIDSRLWRARALAGTDDPNDDSYIELRDKVESTYIELRCAVVNTKQAPKVIIESRRQLESLSAQVGTLEYPTAVLGMIQACLHEQDLGFHRVPEEVMRFDETTVEESYRLALQGLSFKPAAEPPEVRKVRVRRVE